MRVVTVKEILTLDSGETVPAVRGRLKAVYDQNKGVSKRLDADGKPIPWRLQNVVLVDDTGEIKVKLDDRDAVPMTWKGAAVLISCNEGQRGLTGMKAKNDEYRGKVSRILHVTGSAHMELVDGRTVQTAPPENATTPPQGVQASGPSSTPPPPQNAPQGQSGAQHAPSTQGNGNTVSNAAVLRARDYYRVMKAVQTMREGWDKEHTAAKMTDAHFQAACSTVYIQLQRDGVINGN